MDFLDKLASLLTPKRKRHSSNKIKISKKKSADLLSLENTISDTEVRTETPVISKLNVKRKASYAEKNYKPIDKIYNDKYKTNPFRIRLGNGEYLSLNQILPFLEEKLQWAEWTYRNRYGIFTTVGLYLCILFGFSMVSFDVGGESISDGILVEIQDEPKEEIIEEPKEEQDKSEKIDWETELANLISDENSNQKIDYQSNIAGDSPTKLKLRLADMQHEEVVRTMLNYKKGMERIDKEIVEERLLARAKRDSMEQQRKRDESNFSHKKGNVTVSYNLAGRNPIYFEIPAYLCEGGGKVIVDIEVNRSGRIIKAKINQTKSVTDHCLEEMAVWAAKLSEFDAKNDAPEIQKGTITYIFRPQYS